MKSVFYFESFNFNQISNELHLNYSYNKEFFFTEKIKFNLCDNLVSKKDLEQLCFYAHIACGISYYKAHLAKKIEINSGVLNEKEALFFQKFYIKGLGELAYLNKVKLKKRIKFPFVHQLIQPKINLDLKQSDVILVGGGKDSITTIEALERKNSTTKLLSVVSNIDNVPTPIKNTFEHANLDNILIERKLDKKLIKLNKLKNVYNGHVPITGILAFIIAIGAKLYGYDKIILSNERSANVGNVIWDEEEINHQWSKSIEFEKDFNKLIGLRHNTSLYYFSFLRPLSELQIVKQFAKLKKYHKIFTSCNNAFKINEKERIDAWCCNCDKCRFVFLILAPFLEKKDLIGIFGKNLFEEKKQLQGFKELVGESSHKPFECVGEIEESILAFLMLKDTEYEKDFVVKEILSLLDNKYDESELKKKYLDSLEKHNIPEKYMECFNETFKL